MAVVYKWSRLDAELESCACLLQNPSMAAELAQSQQIANMQSPEQQEKLMRLKDDPELKDMFDYIQKNGAGMCQSCALILRSTIAVFQMSPDTLHAVSLALIA